MSAIPTITVHDLHELRNQAEDHFLLDVREPHEHAIANIEGARLIPLATLEGELAALPKDQDIYVHCKSGMRSARAVGLMKQHGFTRVINVSGGIDAWLKGG